MKTINLQIKKDAPLWLFEFTDGYLKINIPDNTIYNNNSSECYLGGVPLAIFKNGESIGGVGSMAVLDPTSSFWIIDYQQILQNFLTPIIVEDPNSIYTIDFYFDFTNDAGGSTACAEYDGYLTELFVAPEQQDELGGEHAIAEVTPLVSKSGQYTLEVVEFSPNSNSNTGLIVGISIIGSLLVIGGVALGIMFFKKRKSKTNI